MADPPRPLADPEAERAVLSSGLLDPASLALVEHLLRPGDFASPARALIYECMVAMRAKQRPLDVVTLADELRARDRLNTVGGAQYLGELTDGYVSPALVESHARIVADLAVRRRIGDVGAILAAEARAGGGASTEQFAARAMELLSAATVRSGGTAMRTYRDVAASVLARIEALGALGEAAPVRIRSGLAELDRYLGSFAGARLYVIAARPAMGKSALMLAAVHQAAADRRATVMLFGLEMEPEENAARWAATAAGVDGRAVTEGESSYEDFVAFANALCALEDLPILWNATDDLSIDDVVASCVRQSFVTPVSMVAIDYLTLLRMNPDAERYDLAVGEVSRKAKGLAKRLGCPVVLLSQLNRSCETRPNKRPLLSDLRQSGDVEQDADAVVFIYRDEVYHPDTDDKGIAELIVAKNRNGPTGTARVGWVPARTAFINLDPEEADAPARRVAGRGAGRYGGGARVGAAPPPPVSDGGSVYDTAGGLPTEEQILPGELDWRDP